MYMRNCITSDFLEIIEDFGISTRRHREYHRSRLFFDLCHSYFNDFSYLLQRSKPIVAKEVSLEFGSVKA